MYYILAPHRRGGCWLKAQNNGQHDNVYAVSGPRTCSGIPQDFGLNKLNAICFFFRMRWPSDGIGWGLVVEQLPLSLWQWPKLCVAYRGWQWPLYWSEVQILPGGTQSLKVTCFDLFHPNWDFSVDWKWLWQSVHLWRKHCWQSTSGAIVRLSWPCRSDVHVPDQPAVPGVPKWFINGRQWLFSDLHCW